MSAGRAVRIALLALAVALVPGTIRLVPSHRGLDRAPVLPGRVGGLPAVGAPVEVAMTPPPADLAGELAPAGPPAPAFAPAELGRSDGETSALVVGIDDYPGRGSDLGAAVADAGTIDAALAGFGLPAGNRVVLRDGQARRDQVVAAIGSLVARSGPGTTIVFAYAGHVRKVGPDTEALVTADGGLVTDQELAALLAPAQGRVWLLLATCFAGGFTEALAPGRVLTGAADADSLAYESPSLNASFLVHHLVREGWLEGRAGRSVQEAYAFADARLAAERPERRPVQLDFVGAPVVLGAGDPTSMRNAAPPQPAAPPPSPPPPTTSTTTPEPTRRCLVVLRCRDT